MSSRSKQDSGASIKRFILVSSALLFINFVYANANGDGNANSKVAINNDGSDNMSGIVGLWKHSANPAWINISSNKNIATAVIERHDNNIKANGSQIIKSITPIKNNNTQWRGKMYSAATDDFVDVSITQINKHTLNVTYTNNTENKTLILTLLRP